MALTNSLEAKGKVFEIVNLNVWNVYLYLMHPFTTVDRKKGKCWTPKITLWPSFHMGLESSILLAYQVDSPGNNIDNTFYISRTISGWNLIKILMMHVKLWSMVKAERKSWKQFIFLFHWISCEVTQIETETIVVFGVFLSFVIQCY